MQGGARGHASTSESGRLGNCVVGDKRHIRTCPVMLKRLRRFQGYGTDTETCLAKGLILWRGIITSSLGSGILALATTKRNGEGAQGE